MKAYSTVICVVFILSLNDCNGENSTPAPNRTTGKVSTVLTTNSQSSKLISKSTATTERTPSTATQQTSVNLTTQKLLSTYSPSTTMKFTSVTQPTQAPMSTTHKSTITSPVTNSSRSTIIVIQSTNNPVTSTLLETQNPVGTSEEPHTTKRSTSTSTEISSPQTSSQIIKSSALKPNTQSPLPTVFSTVTTQLSVSRTTSVNSGLVTSTPMPSVSPLTTTNRDGNKGHNKGDSDSENYDHELVIIFGCMLGLMALAIFVFCVHRCYKKEREKDYREGGGDISITMSKF